MMRMNMDELFKKLSKLAKVVNTADTFAKAEEARNEMIDLLDFHGFWDYEIDSIMSEMLTA